MFKKAVSMLLVFCLMLCVLPNTFNVNAAAKMTIAELKVKFPDSKYWNHADNPGNSNSVNNQDGYTNIPCPVNNGTIGTSSQTCNAFQPATTQLSWQCMGFAEKLGYDFTGYNPRLNQNGWYTYTNASALDTIKPGDIVRRNGHSIFVTAVSGETVTYADCNSDGHCKIRWGRTITKTTLASNFIHVRSAPFAIEQGSASDAEDSSGNVLTLKYNINGGNIPNSDKVTYEYTVVDGKGINLRSGAGTAYGVLAALPKGTVFTVTETKASGGYTWGKTTYNSKTGWCVISEDWTTKKEIRTTAYYSDSAGLIYQSATSELYAERLIYGKTVSGLADAAKLGIKKSGYDFIGWSTSKNGQAINTDGSIKPEDIYPQLATASHTITLYAVWRSNVVLKGIEISALPAKTTYFVGDALDTAGLKLKLKYSDSTEKEISHGFTVSGFDSKKPMELTLTVTYEGKTTSFKVNVVEFLAGDINDDKKVDLFDITLLSQFVAGWDIDCMAQRADVTGDGSTDLNDVILLAQYIAGWDDIELN